ncbi:MAG: hypothetical protein RBR19_08115 [Sedimentisphaerales bacterium]|jgi:hypothetical protein|nr:hypothetical protein [Sedimentisphaerales bacterium]
MMIRRGKLAILGLLLGGAALITCPIGAQADCAMAHTHIGVNPTWRPADWSQPAEGSVDPDPTDDDKLWFFSLPPVHASATPGWPHWEQNNGTAFLVLSPVLDEEQYITKPGDPAKVLYTCNFTYTKANSYGDPSGLVHLDGWHSAHGPQGAWNLESIDETIAPEWEIYLRRERVSVNLDEDDFFMLLPDDTPVLDGNGTTHFLAKRWLTDMNAWGIHDHMGFYFWLDDEDEEVYIVVSAHDASGTYQRSADFVLRFAKTVIQPIPGDLNGDGIVDIHDFEILIENWGKSGICHGKDAEPHDHDHDHDN